MSCAINRRQALVQIAGVAGAITAAPVASALADEHPAHPVAPPDAVGMLYDNTICTGCKACMPACSEANGLPADTALSGGLWHMPLDLNAKTKNIIKLYRGPAREAPPSSSGSACTASIRPASPAARSGPSRRTSGAPSPGTRTRCIGCRYCEVACPFEVPKFEWDRWNPKIVKCEFCFDQRLEKNQQPACTAVCPTGAVIFGKRADLLAKAKERIAATPGKYFEDRVYGEHEAGGTQVLYLSHASVAVRQDRPSQARLDLARSLRHQGHVGDLQVALGAAPRRGDAGRGDQAELGPPRGGET